MKKNAVGIAMMLFAILLLVIWETIGRSALLYTRVIIAEEKIIAGTVITEKMLTEIELPPEGVADNSYLEGEESAIVGQMARYDIGKGQQISDAMLCDDKLYIGEDQALFTLKSGWIDNRSSTIRRGDTVRIMSADGSVFLGEYRVASAKDGSNTEVYTSEENTGHGDSPVDRVTATSSVSQLEIICNINQYNKIYDYICSEQGHSLLIVQVPERG